MVLLLPLLLAPMALASPMFAVPRGGIDKRAPWNPSTNGPFGPLPAEQLDAWESSARASYCGPERLVGWGCGNECTAVPGADVGSVSLLTAGGDNDDIPYYYVAQNGTHVVVSMRGLNWDSSESWTNALGFSYLAPDAKLFPGNAGRVHNGFYSVFDDVRADIVKHVRAAVDGGVTSVLVAGHSMGGSVGQILAVYLQHAVPKAQVMARMFGPARVGDQVWAQYVDDSLKGRYAFMTIQDDIVPHLPPMFLNFRHPANEVWLPNTNRSSEWRKCDGQENIKCSGSVADNGEATITRAHLGPYAGVQMHCD